jgi:hypothetical protein
MNLGKLFGINETFMNITLRDFLNLNEQGTTEYMLAEIQDDTKWTEASSFGSQYHQTETTGDFLNAKFVNDDGREVVFDVFGRVVFQLSR